MNTFRASPELQVPTKNSQLSGLLCEGASHSSEEQQFLSSRQVMNTERTTVTAVKCFLNYILPIWNWLKYPNQKHIGWYMFVDAWLLLTT